MENLTGCSIAFKTRLKLNPLTWLSAIIRIIAKVPYNHIGDIVVRNDEVNVYESVFRGYVATPLSEKIVGLEYGKDFMVYQPNYKAFDEAVFSIEARNMVGRTPYDFSGLFLQQLLYQTTGVWLGRRWHEATKSTYCYESHHYLHRRSNTYKKREVNPRDLFANVYKEFIPLSEEQFLEQL